MVSGGVAIRLPTRSRERWPRSATRAPLVHNITNLVVTNTTANALLAIGASPAMVEGADEVEAFVALSAIRSWSISAP